MYYDNQWVWISGQQLSRDGSPMGHLDALVRVAALPGAGAPPPAGPGTGSPLAAGRAGGAPPTTRALPTPRQRVQNGGRRHRRDDHEANGRVESS
jgi:hypothetical protein